MTVEAYLRARVPGYPFKTEVLESAAISPIFAKPKVLRAIDLADTIEDNVDDEDFIQSLKYAISTLYYSAAGVFSGGSQTEQVRDIRTSVSGFNIAQADRNYYRQRGDDLRIELGCEVEEMVTEETTMFDATHLRSHKR